MENKENKTQGFNTLCETYKDELVELVNGSSLPIGAVYFITRNIMTEIEKTYYASINSESCEEELENGCGVE